VGDVRGCFFAAAGLAAELVGFGRALFVDWVRPAMTGEITEGKEP